MNTFRQRVPRRATLFVFAAIVAGTARPVAAGSMILTSPSQFSGQEQVVTFQGLSPFEILTPAKTLGVDFRYAGTGGGIQAAFDPSSPREFGPSEGTILNQFMPGASIAITFPHAVDRVGFQLRPNPNQGGVLTFRLFNGVTDVDSFTVANRAPPLPARSYLFYGFESAQPFDRLLLVGAGDGRFGLDNLRFERVHAVAVPEPGGVVLLGIGTIGIGLWRRLRVRRRARFIRVPEVRSGEAAKTVQLICLRQSP